MRRADLRRANLKRAAINRRNLRKSRGFAPFAPVRWLDPGLYCGLSAAIFPRMRIPGADYF
ncbi:hypothetical protein [Pseudogemmobacter hezensis]|uniref:hypothetical protein n=1 Tax=Pseudogemmobacter hezensis TaxID=2737662 RepID=UPI00345A60AE